MPVSSVRQDAAHKAKKKPAKGSDLNQTRLETNAGQLQQEKLHIGLHVILQAHGVTNAKVPVGTQTVTPSMPCSHDSPREQRCQKRDQIPATGKRMHPTE